jgi:hypothetical protein
MRQHNRLEQGKPVEGPLVLQFCEQQRCASLCMSYEEEDTCMSYEEEDAPYTSILCAAAMRPLFGFKDFSVGFRLPIHEQCLTPARMRCARLRPQKNMKARELENWEKAQSSRTCVSHRRTSATSMRCSGFTV